MISICYLRNIYWSVNVCQAWSEALAQGQGTGGLGQCPRQAETGGCALSAVCGENNAEGEDTAALAAPGLSLAPAPGDRPQAPHPPPPLGKTPGGLWAAGISLTEERPPSRFVLRGTPGGGGVLRESRRCRDTPQPHRPRTAQASLLLRRNCGGLWNIPAAWPVLQGPGRVWSPRRARTPRSLHDRFSQLVVLPRQGWGLWLTALLETSVQADVPPTVGLMWVKSNHVSAPHAGHRLWLRLFRRLISPTRPRPCGWQRWEPSRGRGRLCLGPCWPPSVEFPSCSLSFSARFRGISSEELLLFAQGTYQPPLTEFFSSLSVPLSHTVPSM